MFNCKAAMITKNCKYVFVFKLISILVLFLYEYFVLYVLFIFVSGIFVHYVCQCVFLASFTNCQKIFTLT